MVPSVPRDAVHLAEILACCQRNTLESVLSIGGGVGERGTGGQSLGQVAGGIGQTPDWWGNDYFDDTYLVDGVPTPFRGYCTYVFFREVNLSDKDEAVGAQGVPLTPGRSIAVDKSLHVYGTPFFIEGELPIESEQSKTPFHRLMIAQDTGSAITGPARADLYFGAGADAGKVSGRLKHSMRFVMLVPKSLDPVERGRNLPVPDPRPSEKIAKLFPQTDPAKDQPNGKAALRPAPATTTGQAITATSSFASAVPLPEPRPAAAPIGDVRGERDFRRRRRDR